MSKETVIANLPIPIQERARIARFLGESMKLNRDGLFDIKTIRVFRDTSPMEIGVEFGGARNDSQLEILEYLMKKANTAQDKSVHTDISAWAVRRITSGMSFEGKKPILIVDLKK